MENSVKTYTAQLDKLGITYKVFEHPHLVKPEEVQSYLGETVADCIVALVMKADDKFVVLLKKGDDYLDFKKAKKLLKVTNLRFSTKEEFEEITGLPFGAARVYIPNLATYIDKNVLTMENRNGGTGSFTYTFKYKTADLLNIPESKIIDIAIKKDDEKKRVLSGIRATGRLHLGNYLGAVKGMLALQDDPTYETFYMVADLHAVTTPFKIEELRVNRREVIIDYLAAGLDPEKSILFQQADVPEHAELAFYFSSVVTIAKMQHLPTFKDKVKQHPESATMALLNYPILMASDILIYKAGLVPVGLDQEPHLEVSREIARRMNQDYHTDFPQPQRFKTAGEYVPSLTGEGKMGKSIEGSFINLSDDLATIKAKLSKVPTDSGKGNMVHDSYIAENGTPSGGVKTLLTLVGLFQGEEARRAYEDNYAAEGIRYGDLKASLAQAISDDLAPLQEKRAYFEAHPKEVDEIIAAGGVKAKAVARETVMEVREKMGLL